MIILGIDPGTVSVGYAVLSGEDKPQIRTSGLVPIRAREHAERLKELDDHLRTLYREWSPDALALEHLFFAKNQKTALRVAEARGVILLTAIRAGLNVYEYAPLEVKKTVSGDGTADKKQVQKMITLIFPEARTLRARDDVFDAIAIALTCFYVEGRQKNKPSKR